MNLRFLLLFAILFSRCDSQDRTLTPEAPVPTVPIRVPDGFFAEIYSAGLALPTSLAFPPDGSDRLFVNELQTGRIRIIEGGVIRETPFAQVPTNVQGGFPVSGENGLLGIAFDPGYPADPYVYVTYGYRTANDTLGAVARFTDVNGQGTDFTILLDSIKSAPGHQIQSLAFGPDGKLYVATGDAYRADQAQDVNSLLGKILRLNPDGTLPADNPFPGSYTYAYGLRNNYDLAFDDQGVLYTAENGPSVNDELNRIEAGGNYGWPVVLGPAHDAAFIDPVHAWSQIVSPDGMLFYRGTQFPAEYRGKLFIVYFGDTHSTGPSPVAKRIQTVDLTATPPVFSDFAVYTFPGLGNPLDVAEGPDGSLYLTDIFQGRVYRIRYTG